MDKRSEARVPTAIRFFVHVHECKDEPELVGVSVACEAVDFSPHGLQFRTDRKLIPKSLLNITIAIAEPFGMYLLLGEIRWVREVEDRYAMGVLLRDEEDTDFAKWESEFDTIFSAN